MQILNSYFDDQKIILTADFYSTVSNRNFRAFHSHNCIEIAYVSMGTADQILMFPDGRMETQKLSKGNYVIVDTQAKHAYRNGSDDFTVINLLFKSSFLFPPTDSEHKQPIPKAFSVTRSRWHDSKEARGVELKFEAKEPRTVEDKKYLRFWLDLREDGGEIDFSEARIGLIANNDLSNPYLIRGKVPFYFMEEGEDCWTVMSHGEGGYFGKDQGSSVRGLRGWFAFPVEEMYREQSGESLSEADLITGVYFYHEMSEEDMAGRSLYVDDFMLVEDYRRAAKKVLCDDKLVDFGDGVLEIMTTGKHGNIAPDAHLEEVKVSVMESEDFYRLVKRTYPNVNYESIDAVTMNQVYFDKDGSLLPLFKMCHTCSREHWEEWEQMVRNGLSLIVLYSMRSMVAGEKNTKENIIDVVKNYVDAYYAEDITLKEICDKHFYNVSYVCRKFKSTLHCSFEQYLRQIRIKHAKEMLLNTHLSVAEVGERSGYTSARTFRKAFALVTGETPLDFRKKYRK